MQKTRLGISVGIFGAACYFMGIISIIPLVVMAGYILLFEQHEWLRKTAVKAVAIVVFFSIISAVIGLVNNASTFLNDIVVLSNGTMNMSSFNRVISLCRTALSFVQALFLLLMGFKALKEGSMKFGAVDNVIDKHM